jgi:hypothetical protein
MRRSVNVIKQLLEECSDEDRDQWKSHAQTVLEAVRGSHPTRRGVRGAIAAAFFESSALPAALQAGWTPDPRIPRPDPFRCAIEKNGKVARILTGVLQVEAGKPVRQVSERGDPIYVAQLPKRPSRVRIVKSADRARPAGETLPPGERGWRMTDFDVLAVSLQPITRHWSDFRYTLSSWLMPSRSHAAFVENLQPVPFETSGSWTSELLTCLEWLSRELADGPVPTDRAG